MSKYKNKYVDFEGSPQLLEQVVGRARYYVQQNSDHARNLVLALLDFAIQTNDEELKEDVHLLFEELQIPKMSCASALSHTNEPASEKNLPNFKNNQEEATLNISQGNITQEDLKTYPALRLLYKLVLDSKECDPKYQLMPYRAALEEGPLLPLMPSVNDFNERFGTRLSPTNYTTYINAVDNPYDKEEKDKRQFDALKREFRAYVKQ